jgi:hypothetical protein
MKAKTKFDPKVVQQFVIEHTEKFVMGLVAVLFLFFAYRSYVVVGNGYQRKPEELKAATKAAFDKIALGPATKKPPAPTTKPVPDGPDFPLYAKIIDDHKLSIDAAKYPMPLGPDGSIFAPLRPREAPEVFAVENLRAIPGRGAVPNANNDRNAGNANPTAGKRWIVVTGLVPYKKQLDEYRNKFATAAGYDPGKDVPTYAGYFVQRAEVVPGATGEPKWSKFTVFDPDDAAAKLGSQKAIELADARFVDTYLTAPLPYLVDTTWGNEAVFPPQIPVVERKADDADPRRIMGRQPRDSGGGRMTGGHTGVRDNATTPRGTDARDMPNRQGGGGLLGPGARAPVAGGGGGGLLNRNVVAKPETPEEKKEVPDYLLLRYVDFDVKPNKQYQYRIFLVLNNPNVGLRAEELADSRLASYQFLGTQQPTTNDKDEVVPWPTDPNVKWSQVCTSGRVSDDMRLLGGTVAAAGGGRPEAVAEVRVLLWQEQSGRNGNFHKDGLFRGTVLEFPQVELKTPGNPRATKRDLNAKGVLVDMLGGEWLDRDHRLANPGMILVMDEFGNLVLHDEAAEAKEWDEATKEPERQDNRPGPAPGKPVRGNVHEGGPSRENPQDDIDTSGVRRKPVR